MDLRKVIKTTEVLSITYSMLVTSIEYVMLFILVFKLFNPDSFRVCSIGKLL